MRFVGRLLAVAAALAVVAVAALLLLDAPLRQRAEAQVAAELRTTVPFTDTPEVTIEGYPLAWYALLNAYPEVRVRADGLPVDSGQGSTVTLSDVRVTLHDVSVGDAATRAGTLRGEALLRYEEISRLAGFPVSHAGGDRVAASGSAQLLGLTVTGNVTGSLVLDRTAQTVALSGPRMEVAGVRLPQAATDALLSRVVQPFAVPLPHGLRLDAVTPGTDGVAATVVGVDVVLPRR